MSKYKEPLSMHSHIKRPNQYKHMIIWTVIISLIPFPFLLNFMFVWSEGMSGGVDNPIFLCIPITLIAILPAIFVGFLLGALIGGFAPKNKPLSSARVKLLTIAIPIIGILLLSFCYILIVLGIPVALFLENPILLPVPFLILGFGTHRYLSKLKEWQRHNHITEKSKRKAKNDV